ncbi:MAG: heparan-alpha-glucosaminide N-acetyltransferase domain-containing protein [Nocardioidaceae bacterium]
MADTLRATRETLLPRTEQGRLLGVDLARALALFGMFCTHLLPTSADGETVTWVQQLFAGRAAALFALLAGVSLALVTAAPGTELRAARAGIVVRALLIGALGLFLGALDTGIAVILTYYAVLFVLGLPFLGMRWRSLAGLAVAWAVLAPVVSHLLRQQLPERTLRNPTFEMATDQPLPLLSELAFTGYYPALPWMVYLLVGLAIGRLPLRRPAVAAAIAVTGAALAVVSWGTSWLLLHPLGGLAQLRRTAPDSTPFDYLSVDQALVQGTFGTTPTTSWWWLTTTAPHSGTPFDLLQTTGSAMLVLGLCLLIGQRVSAKVGLLFAAGAMTLTLYSVHLVALHTDVGPPRETTELLWWHLVGALLLAAIWRAVVGRGPLEACVRWCSQAGRQGVRLVSRPRR